MMSQTSILVDLAVPKETLSQFKVSLLHGLSPVHVLLAGPRRTVMTPCLKRSMESAGDLVHVAVVLPSYVEDF